MLTVIFATDWVAGRDAVLNRIAEDVRMERPGCVLLVPELISHDTERRLCAVAGDTASRFAEVLSFTGLARRVDEAMGHNSPAFMDKGGRLVTMAAAALQLHGQLKAYASVETKPEFLTALVDAIDEFKCCCVSAEDLRLASSNTEGSLAQKLEELSLLFEAYDALCQQGKRDPRDQMTWLLEELEGSGYAKSHRFYIDGFPDFTRQHMRILEHLVASDAPVTISMNCDRSDSHDPAFQKAGRTISELIRFADKNGICVEYQSIEPAQGPLQGLGQLLFQGKIPVGKYQQALHLVRTETIYDEACVVADQITELVAGGCRYRDIAIVCGDLQTYKNTLGMVLRRCGIPSYLSGTEMLLDKSVLNTILTALDAVLDHFGQKDMIRYMKSLLSPVDPAMSDLLENYAILWNIQGSRWNKEWVNHPVELNGKWTEHARNQLKALNQSRQRLMEPLVRLRMALTSSITLKEQVLGLYQFLEDIHFATGLNKLAADLDQNGDNRSAQILNQVWEILVGALEQLHDVLGNTVWDGQTFCRLFKLLISQYDVGTIPTVLDAVTVGSVSSMRCQETKHLFVLGALEGCLPGFGGTGGILSDQERNSLRQLGIPVNGGSSDNLQVDFAEIYGVFNGARQSITVSCPAGQPSYVYKRLVQMADGEMVNPQSLGGAMTNPIEAAAYLAKHEDEKTAELLGIREFYDAMCERREFDIGALSHEGIGQLYGEQLKLSASQIDRQAECRMSYFLKYGLRLKERKTATIDPAEFGTYVHSVMENTAKTVMEKGGFCVLTLEQVVDIATAYSDAYAKDFFSQLESERIGYLFRRNIYELMLIVKELWCEMQTCDFLPVGYEVGFGEGENLASIDVSGEKMPAILSGYVDRVDQWARDTTSYFRVVDYKTGKKDFDYCDVFHGIGLQMLLYLFALEAEGKELLGDKSFSAGVQYFPARVPLVSADGFLTPEKAAEEREALWKRKGLLLDDKDVLFAMENQEKPKRLCVSVSKDGEYCGDIASREQFKLLKKYVFGIVGKMVDDIASGNVSPNPYTRGANHSACAFCPYGSICHRAQVEDIRNCKTMKPDAFWEKVEKEVADHGGTIDKTTGNGGQ